MECTEIYVRKSLSWCLMAFLQKMCLKMEDLTLLAAKVLVGLFHQAKLYQRSPSFVRCQFRVDMIWLKKCFGFVGPEIASRTP